MVSTSTVLWVGVVRLVLGGGKGTEGRGNLGKASEGRGAKRSRAELFSRDGLTCLKLSNTTSFQMIPLIPAISLQYRVYCPPQTICQRPGNGVHSMGTTGVRNGKV